MYVMFCLCTLLLCHMYPTFCTAHVSGLHTIYMLCNKMFITCCRKACPGDVARLSSISGPSPSSKSSLFCLAYSLSNSPSELPNPSSFSISMIKLCKIKQLRIHIFALSRSFSAWIRKRKSVRDWKRPLSEPLKCSIQTRTYKFSH